MKLNPFLNCYEQYNCDYFSDISWKSFSNYYPPWPPYNQCGTGCNSLSDIWMGTYNQCLTPTELECERDAIRSFSYCNKPLVSGSLVQYKLPIVYNVTVDPFYTNPQVAFHGAQVFYGKCSSYSSEN